MRIFTRQLMKFKRQLLTELDQTEAIGGYFLSSVIRDAFVRHFNEFTESECLPKVAYKVSYAVIVNVSSRLHLRGSTLQQLTQGVLLGLMAVGASKQICKPIISGSVRGVRKVIQFKDAYVTPAFARDIVTGLCSAFDVAEDIACIDHMAEEVIRATHHGRRRQDKFIFA